MPSTRPREEAPQAQSTSGPSGEERAGKPSYGLLKTPHDIAFAGITRGVDELGDKLHALSGLGPDPSSRRKKKARGDGADDTAVQSDGSTGDEGPSTATGDLTSHLPDAKRNQPAATEDIDFDPYDGHIRGRLLPTSPPPAESSLSGQMWSRLATVRKLQAELASAHAAMEHITQSSMAAETSAHDERRSEARMGPRTKGEEDIDSYAEMASRFEGRQAAIQGIMSKLDELSKAVTSYHSIPTPELDLLRSRSNTSNTNISDFGPSPRQSLDIFPTVLPNTRSPNAADFSSHLGQRAAKDTRYPTGMRSKVLEDHHPITQSPATEGADHFFPR